MLISFTASCGGFAGVSNSFGSALWAIDYGLQMAYSNFSGALLHVGGQSVYYNVSLPRIDVLVIPDFVRLVCSLSLVRLFQLNPIEYAAESVAQPLQPISRRFINGQLGLSTTLL